MSEYKIIIASTENQESKEGFKDLFKKAFSKIGNGEEHFVLKGSNGNDAIWVNERVNIKSKFEIFIKTDSSAFRTNFQSEINFVANNIFASLVAVANNIENDSSKGDVRKIIVDGSFPVLDSLGNEIGECSINTGIDYSSTNNFLKKVFNVNSADAKEALIELVIKTELEEFDDDFRMGDFSVLYDRLYNPIDLKEKNISELIAHLSEKLDNGFSLEKFSLGLEKTVQETFLTKLYEETQIEQLLRNYITRAREAEEQDILDI